jgi:ribA/ribD-fused uncharacterized protein
MSNNNNSHCPSTPRDKRKTISSGSTPPIVNEKKKSRNIDNTEDMDSTKEVVLEKLEQSVESIKASLQTLIEKSEQKENERKESKDSGDKKLGELAESIQFLTLSIEDMKKTMKDTQESMAHMTQMKEEINCVKAQNVMLMNKLRLQEDYSRRDNMIITGLKEEEEENCRDIVAHFLNSCFEMNIVEVVRTHRLGKPVGTRGEGRKIIVRFKHHEDKEHIMKNRWRLKEKARGVYVEDDFCNETARRRASLYPIVKELKNTDKKAHLRGDKIFTNGRLFSPRHLHDLPVDPHVVSTRSDDDVTVFSGTYSKLSNLHLHPFELDGHEWHSVEHVYQYHKAQDAKDVQAAREIRMTTDPLDAMAIGRQVEATKEWKQKGQAIMLRAQQAKFSIKSLNTVLKNCKPTIAEASYDKFWGTGLSLTHTDAMDHNMWVGENTTGKLLMQVREEILK